MNLQHRIDLLVRLGDYILSNEEEWKEAKAEATAENPLVHTRICRARDQYYCIFISAKSSPRKMDH